ncbi:N-acetylmuramoyl-L-alanine amidase family protein [Robiginitalea sp. IMCC44478]|uniref:N-acetylmuramoyl-L-alanine amidase family protein n=1 Tax=Robiginitalea sp. IMCC44478 TaxID=3459122 RepID=UPI0040422905
MEEAIRKNFVLIFFGLLAMPGLIAQDSLKTVIAEKGDGVYSLLRKHGADPYNQLDEFIALNEDNLRDGLHLFEGVSYMIPVDREITEAAVEAVPGEAEEAVATGTFEIFGKDYETVRFRDNKMEGAVFYLVSGHGGPDPGAVTSYGNTRISEDEYAYDVTLRLARLLLEQGATVYIIVRDPDDGIRDKRILEMDRDEVIYPEQEIPLNQLQRLKQRTEAVNELYRQNIGKYQRLIVTHVDSRSSGQNIDVFFYHHHKSKSGKLLAERIHETFRKKYAYYQPNRVYTGSFEDRSSLYLVKKTLPPMAFIEIGNISNSKDQRRILEPDNRQALANWISEGLLLDFESR